MLWDISEEEKLKIAKEMHGSYNFLKGQENRGKTIYDAFGEELITETEETKTKIMEELKESAHDDGARLWLEEICETKPEMDMEEIKQLAHTGKREDLRYMLEAMIVEKKWEKGWTEFKLKDLTKKEKDVIAKTIKTNHDFLLATDWRDFADTMGYTCNDIEAFRERCFIHLTV